MKKKSISLCMIAKNESDTIGQCIKSALPYVDQIVVVDTGSSDNTREIAANLGAEVWEFPWNNDFSAARNFSLEKARSDWILFMDCDEEIDQNTGQLLLEAVKSDFYHAYYIKVTNILADKNQVSLYSIRLFRNLPQYRFRGKIHEQIAGSILENCGQEKIGRINFTLLHHGYNPEKVNIKAKIMRNISLLEEERNNPKKNDGFYYYNLGIEFIRQGKFQEALEKFIESLKLTVNTAGYAPSLVNKLVVCLIELKRYRDALEQLAYFQEVYPDYSDLYLLEATCHLRCGRFSLAKKSIEKAKAVGNNNTIYPVEGTIFGQKPEALLETYQNLMLADQKKFQLSVCILANNVENNIARCLTSIAELADEIILVTTGCDDNTLNIAYQMGATIFRLNGDKSLSKSRNFACQQASGDWILSLNGEEEVQQADLKTLIDYLNRAEIPAYKVKVKSFFTQNDWSLYQEEALCKIFRNNKAFSYQSCISEDIHRSIADNCREEILGFLPLTIFNYSFILKPPFKQENFKKNIALIVQDIKKFGKNTAVYEALGNEFMKINNFKKALYYLKKALVLSDCPASPSLWYKTVNCLFKLNSFSDAIDLVKKAVQYYPDYTNLFYLEGLCYLKLGSLEEAEKSFTKCLELGEANWEKYLVQPGAGSYLAHCGLAETYLKENNLQKCLKQYQLAARYPEGHNTVIPLLTQVIIENLGAERVLDYLQENNLASGLNLCLASETAIRKDCIITSLMLLDTAFTKIHEEKNSGLYEIISEKIFKLLGRIFNNAIKDNPQNPELENFKCFFKYS
ncbi:MAG: glycosyltransferase [Clostridia bacterium]|nr:glycosyltransferase [Clostridia bacterium]